MVLSVWRVDCGEGCLRVLLLECWRWPDAAAAGCCFRVLSERSVRFGAGGASSAVGYRVLLLQCAG